jgi:predicted RNase H-like nuclease (RuvC/YqgF family)
MTKLSIMLNSLAAGVSLLAIILVQMSVSEHESSALEINNIKKSITDTGDKIKEQALEISSKLMRQKSRNDDLSEQIAEFRQNSQQTTEQLEETKAEIKKLEVSIASMEEEIASLGEREKEAEVKLQEKLQAIQDLRTEIPQITQKVENKKFEIRDFESRSDDLTEKLSTYSEITKILRQHYLDTVSDMSSYARDRPWIEKGESLNMRLGKVDLASGYIALTQGGGEGLREDMYFSVFHHQEEISKIRIRKVFRTHALAEVMPLFGNPSKLLEIKEVDLVAL